MLHTCWCIGFVCLNSNLHLNLIVWSDFKIENPFSFVLFPSILSGLF
jgi:hypothetical protein